MECCYQINLLCSFDGSSANSSKQRLTRKLEVSWGHALSVYIFILTVCSLEHLTSFWASFIFPSLGGALGHGLWTKDNPFMWTWLSCPRHDLWGKRNTFAEGIWQSLAISNISSCSALSVRALRLIIKLILGDLVKISIATWCVWNFQVSPALKRGWYLGVWLCTAINSLDLILCM